MTGRRLEFHPEAVGEAEAHRLCYKERNPAAAEGFAAELEAAFDAILQAPDRCPAYLEGTRRYILRRYPFLVVYRRIGEVLHILAIAHGRRRPGYWKSRS